MGEKPVKLPLPGKWLLEQIISPDVDFSIMGDFQEEYEELYRRQGPFAAWRWFWGQVAVSIVPFLQSTLIWSFAMLKNYFTVVLRVFRKNPVYSVINLFGLSVGIACAILIYFFIRDEYTFDKFHANADRIHEVYVQYRFKNFQVTNQGHLPLAPRLKEDFPEVEDAVRVKKTNLVFRYNDRFHEEKTYAVDNSFFTVFTFPLREGNSRTALANPGSVVLSKRAAAKYFPGTSPLGKTVSVKLAGGDKDFLVTGVSENPPENSSLQFDVLIPVSDYFPNELNDWKNGKSAATFILLKENVAAGPFFEKLMALSGNYFEMPERGKGNGYHGQPLLSAHLGSRYASIYEKVSNENYSFILAGIAIIVLLIACFNFMNLTIGSSSSRVKEIGMRKVLGAQRKTLAQQFWFELMVLSIAALIVGVFLAELFLPVFNELADKSLQLDYIRNLKVGGVLVLISLVVGAVAGGYPVFVLSGLASADLFRGKYKLKGNNLFAKILIVFQFSASIFLIIMTLVMYKQNMFLSQRSLGYNSSAVIAVNLKNTNSNAARAGRLNSFQNRLTGHFEILSSTAAAYDLSSYWASMAVEDKQKKLHYIELNNVDEGYLKTLEVSLKQGRDFSVEYNDVESRAVIVNESFVRLFDLKNPVGMSLSDILNVSSKDKIIGVIPDFHNKSLHAKIYPAMLRMNKEGDYRTLYVKVDGGNLQNALNVIKKEFAAAFPGIPCEYRFLDEQIARLYASEKRWSRIINYASGFALMIACMGLFGLTLLAVVKRTKEISIRKVLGAKTGDIVNLVNREFLFLILIANVIAWPAAYYAAGKLLQNYAYKIHVGIELYLLAGLITLVISVLTVSYNSLKAVFKNPVDALKYE